MTEQEYEDLFRTLRDYAHDSSVEVISYTSDSLNLLVTLDGQFDKKHVIQLANPCFLALPPYVILQSMEFGNLSLLPDDFIQNHFIIFDWEGKEEDLKVVKIITEDDNLFFILFWGQISFY